MQGEATDPAEVPRVRLRRSAAANYLHQRLGQSVSPNTLRSWPISYKQLGRDAVYELVDLDAFIDARLKAAPVRRGAPPALDWAAMVEDRRKLLAANVGPEEARLRAIEFVIGEYRRHTVCRFDEAKAAVLAAIASSPGAPVR
jgi:hypothetical protein